MFAQLAVVAAFLAPLVSALTVDPLVGATSGGRTNITWQAFEGDPSSFSVELRNPTFNNHFAIVNNADASLQRMEVLLPIVPAGEQYFLDLVDIGNITDVLATSAPFIIGETVTTSSTSTTTSGSTTLPSTASGSVISTPSGSPSVPTNTPTGPTNTDTNTGTGTDTTTTPIGSNTPFNNGAVALGFTGSNALSYGLMVIAAFMGATLVGF